MWAAGPQRGPVPMTVAVETEGGAYPFPAVHDPETERAMRLEAAGYERDPSTGEYRRGTWEPVV
jgi:hypothetical protein